jgi:hypothetical protein
MERHSQPAPEDRRGEPRRLPRVGELLGRSFFPFMAIVIILGTLLWGPWVSLLLAAACWSLVTVFV